MSDKENQTPVDEDDRKYLTARPERPLQQAGFMFIPKTWEQLYAYAKEISQTEFVPNQMRGKAGAVLAAWQKGEEVGLAPMAALQSIAVINGRPSIHSSGYWGLITSNRLCEDWNEIAPHETVKIGYGECTIKRRGKKEPVTRRYTIEMARIAGLWGGTGDTKEKREQSVWFKNPGRMLQWRARHLAGEDAIPEAAQGLLPADIAMELEPADSLDVTPPLKMPEPLAESGTAPIDTNEPQLTASTEAEVVKTGEHETKTEKKETVDEIVEWIKTAHVDYFNDTTALTIKLKGRDNAEQMKICRAWNERQKALGK